MYTAIHPVPHYPEPMTITNKPTEPSIPELVKSAAADSKLLVNQQIALAKVEMQQSAKAAGSSVGLLVVGAFTLILFIIFLLVTLAYVLVELGLPVWAGFGIVTLVLLIVGGILCLVGIKKAKRIKGPERALAQMQNTKATLGG